MTPGPTDRPPGGADESVPVEPWSTPDEEVDLGRQREAASASSGRSGEPKDAEASLFPRAEEQLRFRAGLLDAVGQAVIATDLEGAILFWNRAAEELYGWSREAVRNQRIHDLPLSPGRDRFVRETLAAVRRGGSWSGELEGTHSSGDRFPVYVTATPVRDERGTVVGAVGVSTDLRQWKRLERELQEAQRLESVGHMAAGVAQGFNNALTAIEGYADLLRSRLSDDAEARWDLRALLGAARRARELTSQLLAFSRRQVLKPEVVDLSRHVKGRRAMLEAMVGKDATMEFDAEGPRMPIVVDPARFDEVLVHLTLNALEAMPRGGTIRVKVDEVVLSEPSPPHRPVSEASPGESDPKRYGVVSIRDEGEGIPESIRHRVFEPFFTTRQEKGASGLGLSTVHGIIHQSGGWVDVDSQEGDGTEVRVYLPAAEDPGVS